MSEEIALAAADIETVRQLRAALAKADMQVKAWTHIGARGLAVVEAARAYREAVTTLNGINAAEQTLWAALDSYDASEKARME